MEDQPELESGFRDLGERFERWRTAQQDRHDKFEVELRDRYGKLGSRLDALDRRTDGLESNLGDVRTETTRIGAQLDRHVGEFAAYRTQQERRHEVVKAQFDLLQLQRSWDRRFGKREEIRALARGLVHELSPELPERGVSRTQHLALVVEQQAAFDPGFWLSHALRAVAAGYVKDDVWSDAAEIQAVSLSPAKARLFFALAAARVKDHVAAGTWMDMYLTKLDPQRLGRDFFVVLDAVASRELGDRAWSFARQAMDRWGAEATAEPEAVRASLGRWEPRLRALVRPLPEGGYPHLVRVVKASDWAALRAGWEQATVAGCVLAHLQREFTVVEGEERSTPTQHIDRALERLIDHPEPDEARMLTQEEWLKTFIGHDADEARAREEHERRQQVDAEVMDFATLLDNAVFKPSLVSLGHRARRLALSLVWSRLQLTAEAMTEGSVHSRKPTITVRIEDCAVSLPTDRARRVDASAIEEALSKEITARTERRAEAIRHSLPRLIGANAAGLVAAVAAPFLFDGGSAVLFALLGLGACVWGLFDLRRVPAQRRTCQVEGERRLLRARQQIPDVLQEWERFLAEWDANAARLAELRALNPMTG
ncbi:hypothetical protein ABT186_15110 [Streptomyces sp. NPDC001634]|uniref:hypothetical protein n=1 Tax=Streptomyces sp. NPDC001634 TaxID=3154390 RepID=UPI003326900E